MKYIYTFGLILLATLAQSQALVTFVNNHAFHTLMDVEVVNSSQVVIAGEAGIAYVGASDPLVVDAGTALTVKWYHSGTTMLAGSSTYTYDNSSQNISLAHGTSGSNFAMTTQKMELITNFDLFKCDAMNCVPGSQSVNFILRSTQQLMGSALTVSRLVAAAIPPRPRQLERRHGA